MKKINTILSAILICMISQMNVFATVNPSVIQETIDTLQPKAGNQKDYMEKGVKQIAKLWQNHDGNDEAFKAFCLKNYVADPIEKEMVFLKISDYMEGINGHFNAMRLRLGWNITIAEGEVSPIDEQFAAYSPSSHLSEDFYNNKIAFYIALNFPELSLEEKEALGNNRKAWAYARLGDYYTQRIPSEIQQRRAKISSDNDIYISSYNIYMGHLLDQKGNKLFPQDQILLSHWNLRDEIKANYNKGKEGLNKQRTVYEVMKRIIGQDIPVEVINSGEYDWNPYTNDMYKSGNKVTATPESTVRYEKLLSHFNSMQEVDEYTGNTYIDRRFNNGMEIAVDEVTKLFETYLSAPELKEVGKIISKRLGRKLEAYDIWYDGFKARSNLDETKLDNQTRALYPDAKAMEKDLPNILVKLGFSPERAEYLAEKIAVDPARGSGHAWAAAMKGAKSRLRTRIPPQGMDYKGYNIAIHEFGHNVEQTISLYDMDYFMLKGVPNTSFSEALAFVFQKRDLEILGIDNPDPEKEKMDILDRIWSLYEISGVSLVDISVWKWMYANPNATATQLRDAVISIAKEVWNTYYAPVFGIKDQTILAVYSHMIDSPLYLSNYAFGQIIEFQLEKHLEGKDFASEVDRIFSLGRLTPTEWMKQATGDPLTVTPLLQAVSKVL